MSSAEQSVAEQSLNNFFAAWGEADADARAKLIAAAFGDSIYYCDPHGDTAMTDAATLTAFVGGFTQQMPRGSAEVVTITQHHSHARATVAFKMGDKVMMHGQYFADLDDQGHLTRLIGFPGMGAPE